LEIIDAELIKETITSEIDIEEKIAKIATGFVMGRFDLSMKECKRRDTTSTRYTWEVDGRKIYLFRPFHLTAKQLRKWLEDNITDINPDAPHEQDRIQKIIDQKHPCGAKIRTDDPEIIEVPEREDDPWSDQEYLGGTSIQADDPEIADDPGMEDKPSIECNEGSQFCSSLSAYVAKEKSENLDDLRPAIGSLGQEGVYDLVSRIFGDMTDGQYNLSKVARDFNLSKATLSRFAGSDWRKEVAKKKDVREDMKQLSKADIPDLWINTTHVLAENRTFMETVRNTGLGGVIDDILPIVGPKEG
jgi:hypothetical protein